VLLEELREEGGGKEGAKWTQQQRERSREKNKPSDAKLF